MSRVFLAGFKAGKSRYEQIADAEDVLICAVDVSEPIYRVNQGGWVFNKHDKMAGRFTLNESKRWYYKSIEGDLQMNTKHTEILEAQKDVFERLLSLGWRE